MRAALAAVLWAPLAMAQPTARDGPARPGTPEPRTGPGYPAKAEVCQGCHGPGGNTVDPAYPNLAGQSARYIYLQLRDFQEGRRTEPLMEALVKTLSRDDMREIADWFARQKPTPMAFAPDPDKVRRGKAKSEETLCTMCHLGGFMGQNEIPRVQGQQPQYVMKQLRDFKARRRTNDAGNMTAVSATLSDEDIEALAHYIASL